ncbi:unnamed protein product, partial [Menidia menidia]
MICLFSQNVRGLRSELKIREILGMNYDVLMVQETKWDDTLVNRIKASTKGQVFASNWQGRGRGVATLLRGGLFEAVRIDLCLVAEDVMKGVLGMEYQESCWSDHFSMVLRVGRGGAKRNGGPWCFNNTFLQQPPLSGRCGIQGDCVGEIMVVSNKLSREDSDFCEGQLDITEVQEAIVQLNKNKSPGSDGLTAEFFQFFTSFLSPMLHRLASGPKINTKKSTVMYCGEVEQTPGRWDFQRAEQSVRVLGVQLGVKQTAARDAVWEQQLEGVAAILGLASEQQRKIGLIRHGTEPEGASLCSA